MVFSQNEILIMIGVVSVLLLCITILTILDIREYLKVKKGLIIEEDEDIKVEVEEPKLEPIQVTLHEDIKPEEVMITTNTSNTEDVLLEEMEEEKFDVKEEDKVLIQEIKEEPQTIIIKEEKEEPLIAEIKEEVVVPQIQEVVDPVVEKKEKKRLEIFEELDELEEKLPNKLDDVTNFEMEQERTAIISLDELLAKSDELYNDNEFVQYDDGNEPITIDEVISRFRKDSEPVSVVSKEDTAPIPVVMQEIEEDEVLTTSNVKEVPPFISSIYGIETDNNALEFENTATYEKLDRENYNDFVAKLREMNEKE